jgi:putative glutamine amidotransferase
MTSPCLVWLPADHRLLGEEGDRTPFAVLADQYASAVKICAQAQPVMFPLAEVAQIPDLLRLVDGVLLPGSASNVHPSHFNEAVADTALPLDPVRDALTLALVRACLEQAVPLLGVCRGFQEINVALGGSLHQQVQAVAGLMDHREPPNVLPDIQYAPAHEVRFVSGSSFERWAGGTRFRVNSLHGQGVHRLAPGLRAVGHAPDGLVEAFEIDAAKSFACAVQWHPEWRCAESRLNAGLFQAFGDACRVRQQARHRDYRAGP